MKKQIGFLLLSLVFVLLAKAQPNFYGITPGNGTGVISKYNPSTNSLTAIYTFQNSGYDPYGSEFVEVSGKLYGTTAHGGTFNKG
ncbi:MAG: hypothetical protein J7502_16920, partial [Flavisolibacter sp.]|nr:hypothetical protein [Flavisolibacter sp.]